MLGLMGENQFSGWFSEMLEYFFSLNCREAQRSLSIFVPAMVFISLSHAWPKLKWHSLDLFFRLNITDAVNFNIALTAHSSCALPLVGWLWEGRKLKWRSFNIGCAIWVYFFSALS